MTTVQTSLTPFSTPGPGAFDDGFDTYLKRLQARFESFEGQPLFYTDTPELFTTYLAAFPREWRQFHTCNCCRRFIESYGNVVTIDTHGRVHSVLWDPAEAPEAYRGAISQLKVRVELSKISGVFFAKEKLLGTPQSTAHGKTTTATNWDGTRIWTHFHVYQKQPYANRLLTAGQAMAAKLEDYRTVRRALEAYSLKHLDLAVQLLDSEALYRSEKVLGAAKWLHAVKVHEKNEKLVWRDIALAPEGFCHPRSSMIGTLLDDIAADLPLETIKRKFAEKMNPLQYMRPQAPPSAGNIRAAEDIVKKLGIERSLERRFARLEEIDTLWRPKGAKEPSGEGVFGHLTPKGAPQRTPLTGAGGDITWVKFQRDVLPKADRIELEVPSRGRFYAFTTALHPDAPPILRWDREDDRNPFAWYTPHDGGHASVWMHRGGGLVEVAAVAAFPHMWRGRTTQGDDGVLFVLPDCRDSRTGSGNALFPECLKGELHAVRSTVEAYSRSAELHGRAEASACGVALRAGSSRAMFSGVRVAVTAGSVKTLYNLDRWE